MKTLIAILVILAFLQTTIIPLDLVLIALICRAYLKTETSNLYLAFGFGLLISFLELLPLGLLSINYLILIQLTQAFKKLPLAGRFFLIIPLSFVFLVINQVTLSFFNEQSLELFPKIIYEGLLTYPVVYLLRLWEERFIVKKEIKLKI